MERVFADLFLDAHGTPPEEMVLDLDTDDPLLQRQLGPPKKTAVRQHRSSSAAHAVDGLGPRGRLLGREVFYRHLDNRREVASSFGLTHSPYNSGGMRSDQGMGKAGNSRALAIELAWPWVRHQLESALAHRFRERAGTTTGRIRRIAIVALARKLMIATLALSHQRDDPGRSRYEADLIAPPAGSAATERRASPAHALCSAPIAADLTRPALPCNDAVSSRSDAFSIEFTHGNCLLGAACKGKKNARYEEGRRLYNTIGHSPGNGG